MDGEFDFETVFATEAELWDLEGRLGRERRQLREELSAAFRRCNADTLRDVAEREYPLTKPEKRAVRRETAGPVRFLPEWEDRYRELAADQRTARGRLAAFHRDVFEALAADAPYDLHVEANTTMLDRPYLEVRARGEGGVVVLELDTPTTEGYAYRTTAEYTERDVENALRLCESLDEVDGERLGLLTHDTELVDAAVGADAADATQLQHRVRVEILEGLEAVDYEYLETEASPVLLFVETADAYLGGS